MPAERRGRGHGREQGGVEELNSWMMATSTRASCGRLCRRARILQADHRASSRGREGSHCRTCAPTAADFRFKSTFGGFPRGTLREVRSRKEWKHTVQLVVRGVRCPVQLDRPEPSVGFSGQYEPAMRRCFGFTRHLRVNAKISCVHSKIAGQLASWKEELGGRRRQVIVCPGFT